MSNNDAIKLNFKMFRFEKMTWYYGNFKVDKMGYKNTK